MHPHLGTLCLPQGRYVAVKSRHLTFQQHSAGLGKGYFERQPTTERLRSDPELYADKTSTLSISSHCASPACTSSVARAQHRSSTRLSPTAPPPVSAPTVRPSAARDRGGGNVYRHARDQIQISWSAEATPPEKPKTCLESIVIDGERRAEQLPRLVLDIVPVWSAGANWLARKDAISFCQSPELGGSVLSSA